MSLCWKIPHLLSCTVCSHTAVFPSQCTYSTTHPQSPGGALTRLVTSKGFPSMIQMLFLKVPYSCKCSPELTAARHISKDACYAKHNFLQDTSVSNKLIVTDCLCKNASWTQLITGKTFIFSIWGFTWMRKNRKVSQVEGREKQWVELLPFPTNSASANGTSQSIIY